jgi:hypothetical protein
MGWHPMQPFLAPGFLLFSLQPEKQTKEIRRMTGSRVRWYGGDPDFIEIFFILLLM